MESHAIKKIREEKELNFEEAIPTKKKQRSQMYEKEMDVPELETISVEASSSTASTTVPTTTMTSIPTTSAILTTSAIPTSQIRAKSHTVSMHGIKVPVGSKTEPHIQIIVNDRMGVKITVSVPVSATVGDLKKKIATHMGKQPHRLRLQRGNRTLNDLVPILDYDISHSSSVELYYN